MAISAVAYCKRCTAKYGASVLNTHDAHGGRKAKPFIFYKTQAKPFIFYKTQFAHNVRRKTRQATNLCVIIYLHKAVVPCQNKIILKNFRPVGRPS